IVSISLMAGLRSVRKPVQLALEIPAVRHLYFAQVRHYNFAVTMAPIIIPFMSNYFVLECTGRSDWAFRSSGLRNTLPTADAQRDYAAL
ncbi:hypothetical protein, partial [Caballeronia novacaledonica]|uniref:hypothetical protein n=1 Tax=Caballeronia novacaledonica TaxID=1544861 RepID=UPI001EE1FEF0